MTWSIEELSDADIAEIQRVPGCCQSLKNSGGVGDNDAFIGVEQSTSDTEGK